MKKLFFKLLFFFLLFNVNISKAQTYTSSKYNYTDYSINDASSTYPGYGSSRVQFSGLPNEATITKIIINIRIVHDSHSDLRAKFVYSTSDPSVFINHTLFNVGSYNNSGVLEKEFTLYPNMSPNPNRTFELELRDSTEGNTGYIDSFGVTIEYEVLPSVDSVSPLSANTNQEVTFTIRGTNLTGGMRFSVDNLENIQELNNGTSTERYFKGVFRGGTGYKIGKVSDATHGITLLRFDVNVIETNSTCNFSDISPSDWYYDAIIDLCNRGLIDDDGDAEHAKNINRAELAKLAYLSVDLQNNSLADNFHIPIVDLQDESIWYYKYAKNLIYLEFGDGVSPFDKNVNFYPSKEITRAHVLKVLLETWNINEKVNSGSNPFSDVKTTDDTYHYIIKAKDLGIIDSGNSFRPNDKALRAEVFVMLHRMLTVNPQQKPTINEGAFNKTGIYTPQNLNNFSSIHSGNFNNRTETSFGIASVGIPLVFSHTYNSYLSDMPKELSYLQPLGKMWTHSFNSYIQEFEADPKFPEYFRIGLTLPNGGFQFYKKQGQNYVPETEGIYDELEKTGANYFTLTTKGQIKYKFQKVNSDSRFYVLQSIKDRNNNELKITYEVGETVLKEGNEEETLVRIKEVTGTSGRKLTFSYYAQSDLLKQVTDPLGRSIYFFYDAYGYLQSYVNPKGLITTYNYGTNKEKDLLKTITLPKGNVITSSYENKKLKSIETSGTNPKKYTYVYDNTKGYIDEIISLTGKKTEIDFNKHGNLTNLKDGTTEVEIKYENTDHINYPTEVTYNSQKTSVTYDDKGNVLQRMLPEGVTQTYAYNERNDIEQFTDPKGNVYKYAYDSRGNLIRVETPRAKTTFTVNDKGLVTQVTNPENISVSFTYDTYGNVIQTNAPEEITTSATFDIASRLLTSTNPKGNTVSYNYDANDNLLSELFGGQTTTYEFDANDNLTKIINAKNKATTLKYNQDDDTLEEIQFGGAVDKYSYDNDGYIKTYTNPKEVVFTYEYFEDKKLKSVTSGGNLVSYTYDNLDRVESVTKNNQETLTFTYDGLDRITSVKDYYNKTVEYSYDKNSNVTSITYPGDKKVTYTYYTDNLLKTVTDWNNNTTEYTYRDDGLLTQTLYPNGTKCTFLYDGAGRMVAKTWKKSDDTIINAYSFHLDKMGNHTQEIKTEPFEVIPLNTETQNYSYTDTNRLESVNNTAFDFDKNGNNTVKGETQYSYDIYDRLIGISKTGYTAEYKYDAYGNRREKTVNGTTQRFVLGILGLSNVLAETDEHGAYQNYYVYGLGLISRTDASNTTHYYHDDFRGSTIAMTDDSEAITHKYAYDDFGKVTQIEEANFNPYRYVGKYGIQYEDEDLYFMRARYYNPDVGRFLTEDPIWATNLYPYAGNNPVMNVDPSGESFINGEFLWNAFVNTITDGEFMLNGFQNTLDAAGMIPVAGEVADGINGGIYLLRGNEEYAALSFAAMSPVGGQAATATKWGAKGLKALPSGGKIVKHHIFNVFRGKSPKSQVYRDFFKKHGIDLDANTVHIPESLHKEIHRAGNNWTTKWKRWIDANPNATTKEVYQQAGRMMDEYGLNKFPILPYK
jgi:RHS repeat-associated protein